MMRMEGPKALEEREEISFVDGFRIRAYETPPTEPLENISALDDLNRSAVPYLPRITVKDTPGKSSWVQCDDCLKWRRIPQGIRAEDLPDVWTCRVDNISCDEEEKLSDEVDPSFSASGSVAETRSGTESVTDVPVSVDWPGLPEFLVDGDNERQDFYTQLAQLLRSQGHTLHFYPKLEGEYLDLFTLFQQVIKHGGYVKVTQKRWWGRILAALDINSFPSRLQSRYEKFLLPLEHAKFHSATPSMGTANASEAVPEQQTPRKSTVKQNRASQSSRGAEWPLSKALHSSSLPTATSAVPRSSHSSSGMAGASTSQSPSDAQLADAAVEKFMCLMQQELTSFKSSLSLLENKISTIDSNLTASLNSYQTRTQKNLSLVREGILRLSDTVNQQAQKGHQHLQSTSLQHPQPGSHHPSKPQPGMLITTHPEDQQMSIGVAQVQPSQQCQELTDLTRTSDALTSRLVPQEPQKQPVVHATSGQPCTTAAPVAKKAAPVFGGDGIASARETPVPLAVDSTQVQQQMLHAAKHQSNGVAPA